MNMTYLTIRNLFLWAAALLIPAYLQIPLLTSVVVYGIWVALGIWMVSLVVAFFSFDVLSYKDFQKYENTLREISKHPWLVAVKVFLVALMMIHVGYLYMAGMYLVTSFMGDLWTSKAIKFYDSNSNKS